MKVVVCGAGISGIPLACALHDQGVDVEVFEQSAELRTVGAGIQISPNMTRALYSLGIGEDAVRLFHQPSRTDCVMGETGETISWTYYNGADARRVYGYPWLMAHRGDLLKLFRTAAGRRGINVRLGERLVSVDDGGAGAGEGRGDVRAVFSGAGEVRCDLLVGADGIKSVCRDYVVGAPSPVTFTGTVAYRCLIPLSKCGHLVDNRNIAYFGPGRSSVGYKVHAPGTGEPMYNCVFFVKNPKREWKGEDWNYPAAPEELREEYTHWCPAARDLIATVDYCAKWAVFERTELPTWRRGGVVLCGDACHAMQPFMSQGAGMAVEDAMSLAFCISAAHRGEVALPDALATYEKVRKPRGTKLQKLSTHAELLWHLEGKGVMSRIARLCRSHHDQNLLDSVWLSGYDVVSETAKALGVHAPAAVPANVPPLSEAVQRHPPITARARVPGSRL